MRSCTPLWYSFWDEEFCHDVHFASKVVRNIAISVYVCLSVCPLAYLKNHTSKLCDVFCTCYVTCGRDSVLLWRQCNTLCDSGFVDDVMFSHNGANRTESITTLCLVFARWRHKSAAATSAPTVKFALSDCLVGFNFSLILRTCVEPCGR